MREIKFRAWDKKRLEMADVAIIDWDNKKPYVIVTEEYVWNKDPETGEAECAIDLSDCELMQFTGLYDRNKTPIYEGDIVKIIDKPSGINTVDVVEWNTPEACFNAGEYGVGQYSDIEIIGNIYQDSKLLEK